MMIVSMVGILVAGFTIWKQTDGVLASELPFYQDATFTPSWFESSDEIPVDFHAIPAFSLTDQDGMTLTEQDFEGKLVIANFFFTECPGICPSTMGNMRRVQDAFILDDDIVMVSHSVTPEKDDVEELSTFASQKQILSSKWHLVTGDRGTIYDLGKHGYFAEEDLGERAPDTGDSVFLHTEQLFLLDGNRRIRGVYNGMNSTSVLQLIEDVKTLKKEL